MFLPDTSSPLDILLHGETNMWYNQPSPHAHLQAAPPPQLHQLNTSPLHHLPTPPPVHPSHPAPSGLFALAAASPADVTSASNSTNAAAVFTGARGTAGGARAARGGRPRGGHAGASRAHAHAHAQGGVAGGHGAGGNDEAVVLPHERYVRVAAMAADEAKIKYRNELKTEQRRRELEARERGEPLSARDKERERSRRESSVTRRRAEVYVAQLENMARRLPGAETELLNLRRELQALRAMRGVAGGRGRDDAAADVDVDVGVDVGGQQRGEADGMLVEGSATGSISMSASDGGVKAE